MTTELLAAAILDMNLHNLTDTEGIDVVAYERSYGPTGLIPEIAPATIFYFNHIIGGYACRLLQAICGQTCWTTMLLGIQGTRHFRQGNRRPFPAAMCWKRRQ